MWHPHGDSGETAGQVSFGEVGDVDELEADREPLDEWPVEEVDDEPSMFVHIITAGGAGAEVGVGGGAGGVDNQSTGAQHAAEFAGDAAYQAYNDHPDHVAFVQGRWIPEVSEFLEIDYQTR